MIIFGFIRILVLIIRILILVCCFVIIIGFFILNVVFLIDVFIICVLSLFIVSLVGAFIHVINGNISFIYMFAELIHLTSFVYSISICIPKVLLIIFIFYAREIDLALNLSAFISYYYSIYLIYLFKIFN